MSRQADRVELESGICNLPNEFRKVARLANQAGLDGYCVADVELGMDLEAARAALLEPGSDLQDLQQALAAFVVVTYTERVNYAGPDST